MIALICIVILFSQRLINVLVPYQLGVLIESLGQGRMPYQQIALYEVNREFWALYRGFQMATTRRWGKEALDSHAARNSE